MNMISAIHYPDLQFIQNIELNYGINRGVYNTIDTWFFKHGYHNITERRKEIIIFLESYYRFYKNDKGKMQFGKGNLVSLLEDFECKKSIVLEMYI